MCQKKTKKDEDDDWPVLQSSQTKSKCPSNGPYPERNTWGNWLKEGQATLGPSKAREKDDLVGWQEEKRK